MTPVFPQRFRAQLPLLISFPHFRRSFGRLKTLPFSRPPSLPEMEVTPEAQRQPRELAICQGLEYLVLVLVVSGAYFVAWCTAERVSVAFAPAALIMIVHIVYLSIYSLEYSGVIDGEHCERLINCVEGLCPVDNFFARTPPTLVFWPRRVLTFMARAADNIKPTDEDGSVED